mgnify:CR=1 FL=1
MCQSDDSYKIFYKRKDLAQAKSCYPKYTEGAVVLSKDSTIYMNPTVKEAPRQLRFPLIRHPIDRDYFDYYMDFSIKKSRRQQ